MASSSHVDVEKAGFLSVEAAEATSSEASSPTDAGKRTGASGRGFVLRHAAFLAALIAIGSAIAATVVLARKGGQAATSESGIVALAEMRGQLPCGLTEPNIKYTFRAPAFDVIGGIADLEQCRTRCFENAKCSAWTLLESDCSLFQIEQDEIPNKENVDGALSGGLPCGGDYIRPVGGIYCFAVMNPYGYEKGLLEYILAQQTSLFACDEYDVYSNKSMVLSDRIETVVVDVDLHCESGGEFGTALNLDIFLAIWDAVFRKLKWVNNEWTVKVDPDAVFFPDRLREVLAHHPPTERGVYLNNCKFGMHGPIEVFSKSAIGAFQDAGINCKGYFEQQCGGDCKWGEDLWVDQCLEKVLGVQRDDEWKLLIEDHCDAPTPWSATTACDKDHVSFHPFKDVESYALCMSYAQLPATQVADLVIRD